MKIIISISFAIFVMVSCRSTRQIQTAITKKDSSIVTATPATTPDSTIAIRATLDQMKANRISFQTFTAKVNVDYKGGDGKSYNVNANVRMYRDSAIWINVNAILGIDAMRVLITRDSVKLINKINKTYTARSVDYLQDVTALPLDLSILQDLLIGNPVFTDSNVIAFSTSSTSTSIMMRGKFFKNLLTLMEPGKQLTHSKLDDVDVARNRTADLTYGEYENKKGQNFSTKRSISVSEKTRLDIQMDFKQYDFNQEVSFPFSVPKNYDKQ